MGTFQKQLRAIEDGLNEVIDLPKFWELAEARLESAGTRDKTINIKISINTARMMVGAEKKTFKAWNMLCRKHTAEPIEIGGLSSG